MPGLRWSPPVAYGSRRALVFVIAAAILTPLAYTLFTHQVWEDYFIIFRCSKNLCEGKGLLYNPPERVHAYTSPLGVLLPALGYWLTGMQSYLAALFLFRAVSIAAFAGGAWLFWRALEQDPGPRGASVLFSILYVLDAKSVAFSTNGMETGLMVLFLALGVHSLSVPGGAPWLARGVCWAGLLWTRPDGCVYIAALGMAELVFWERPRRGLIGEWIRSGLVCTAIYLPWFAFAWSYYGTPVPNSLSAKSSYLGSYRDYFGEAILHAPTNFVRKSRDIFAPIYWGWPEWIRQVSAVLSAFCCVYWLLPLRDRLGRMVSLCFAVLCGYTLLVPFLFPWYLAPITICGYIVLTRGILTLLDRTPVLRVAGWLILGALAVETASIFVLTAWEMRIQQEVIEHRNRIPLAYWLKRHVKPEELVLLECPGYIGFFSDAKIADFPGIVSPAVVELNRNGGTGFFDAIVNMQPEWVVARPVQAAGIQMVRVRGSRYELAALFDVRAEIERIAWLPGREYLLNDAMFLILHRVPERRR